MKKLALVLALILAPGTAFAENWIRAFAPGEVEAGASLFMPAAAESELERGLRSEIGSLLSAQGYAVGDNSDTDYRISFSADVTEAGRRGLPRSPITLAHDPYSRPGASLSEQLRDNGEIRPTVDIGPRPKKEPRGAVLAMSILVLRNEERVWSGYAQGDLGGATRSVLAKAMAEALLADFAQESARDGVNFDVEPVSYADDAVLGGDNE